MNDKNNDVVTPYQHAASRSITTGGVTYAYRELGSTGTVPDTVESMADDAYAFITALGFTTVDILSFSLGRMVAQALVLKHPNWSAS